MRSEAPSEDMPPVLFPKLRQLVLIESPPSPFGGLEKHAKATIKLNMRNGGGETNCQRNAWSQVLERMRVLVTA